MNTKREIILNKLQNLGIDLEADLSVNLFEYGLDSLNLVRLVMSLEKAFSVRIASKDFKREHYSTLDSIERQIELLERHKA